MKHYFYYFYLFIFTTLVNAVYADAAVYTPLTPGLAGKTDLNSFIDWLIGSVLSVGSALAVLMIVIGGFRILLMAGNPSARSEAKNMTWNALFGLGILVLSYLILKSIDSDLVNFSF
jgi:hypothetical protein